MYPNQTGFPQPQFPQYGQQAYQSGPSPAKKAKGNGPVITRYPPPPGYRPPPSQPLPPYAGQQPIWPPQPQPQVYGYGQPAGAYSGHPQPQYAPSVYQPPPVQYPGYPPQQMQHPLPAYPPAAVAYQPGALPGWQQQLGPYSSTTPAAYQPPPISFHPTHSAQQHQPQAANQPHRNASGSLLDGNGDVMPAMDLTQTIGEDLEEDFDGECYFARNPEEINPELSLGVIEWKAPIATKHSLPSTFKDAELEAIAPRPSLPSDEESVSSYFILAKRDEALLSVRQMDDWHEVKDSIIYKEFPARCSEIISIPTLLARYQFRYDAEWAARDPSEAHSPTPELSRGPTPARGESDGWRNSQGADLDREREGAVMSREKSEAPSGHSGSLDNLEHEFHSDNRRSIPPRHTPSHSRASSVASQHHGGQGKINRPKPLPPVRDQTQEEMLAALGVTGSPKLVYETPGPAFGPRPSTAGSEHGNSRANSVDISHGRFPVPPPPPGPPPGHPPRSLRGGYDSWSAHSSRLRGSDYHSRQPSNGYSQQRSNGFDQERRGSASSNRTAAGSDFDGDDNDATPRAKNTNNLSRKRSFADSREGSRTEHDDEETPKQRRKQQRVQDVHEAIVPDAYHRRW